MIVLNKDKYSIDNKRLQPPISQTKVVFVIDSLGKGGAEKFLISLMNTVNKMGIQPIVISLSNFNPSINEIDPTIKKFILIRRYRYDLNICNQIKEIILREKAEKVFCIGAFAFFLSKLLLIPKSNIKFFLSLHTTVPFTLKNHVLDTIYLRFVGKKDQVIFLCNNQRLYYKNKYRYSSDNSRVIYNGIDENYSRSISNSSLRKTYSLVREELNIPSDARVIIKVANIHKVKGHKYAVEALNILHTQFKTEAHLILVGASDEANLKSLVEEIEKYNLSGFVHIVGPKADVRPYLIASDIFTLTSFSETFSIAALEAMTFGLPCCLTNVGGASEMLEENKTGVLCIAKDSFSIASSWRSLIEKNLDKEYIKEYIRSKFSFDKMVDNYLEAILHN